MLGLLRSVLQAYGPCSQACSLPALYGTDTQHCPLVLGSEEVQLFDPVEALTWAGTDTTRIWDNKSKDEVPVHELAAFSSAFSQVIQPIDFLR